MSTLIALPLLPRYHAPSRSFQTTVTFAWPKVFPRYGANRESVFSTVQVLLYVRIIHLSGPQHYFLHSFSIPVIFKQDVVHVNTVRCVFVPHTATWFGPTHPTSSSAVVNTTVWKERPNAHFLKSPLL